MADRFAEEASRIIESVNRSLLTNSPDTNLYESCINKLSALLRIARQEDSAVALFSGQSRPVTATALRGLLWFKYRDGNLGNKDREVGQRFLDFIQASKERLL